MSDRAFQQSLRRFGVTVTSSSSSSGASASASAAAAVASSNSSEAAKNDRPKPFLLNLLTRGGGDRDAPLNREKEREKKEKRRQRRREEEEEEEEQQQHRQLRREEKKSKTTKTTTPPPSLANLSSSLLAPCPVCGALFRRGLELDAHVAAEVAAGLFDEDQEGKRGAREVKKAGPLLPSPLRVLLPAAAPLRGGRKGANSSSSAAASAVFELSDARAEVSLLKKSTREKAELLLENNRQQQQQRGQGQGGGRPPPPVQVLRLPQLEQRFDHFADGAGAWGDETLGIDGALGAQAWQARGVSGIGDPFRGASGGAAGE